MTTAAHTRIPATADPMITGRSGELWVISVAVNAPTVVPVLSIAVVDVLTVVLVLSIVVVDVLTEIVVLSCVLTPVWRRITKVTYAFFPLVLTIHLSL